MYDQTYQPAELSPDHAISIRVLDTDEIDDVSGGFICGGLCIAGAAFGAGALVGSGFAIGWHSAQ